jgi:MFS family permease
MLGWRASGAFGFFDSAHPDDITKNFFLFSATHQGDWHPLSNGPGTGPYPYRLKWEKILRNNRFRMLLTAYTLSQFSEGMTQTSLTWIAFRSADNHIGLVATIGLIQTIIPFFVILPAGYLADRFPAPPLLAGVNLFKGATYALIPLISLLEPISPNSILSIVILTAVLSSFFIPAFGAMIPSLVPADGIKKANGWILIFGQGGYLLGPLTAGILLFHMNAPWLILISGSGFVLSAVLMVLVPTLPDGRLTGQTSKSPTRTHWSALQKDIMQILHLFRERPRLVLAVVALGVYGLVNAPLPVLFPLMATEIFRMDKGFYTILAGSYFSGAFLAGLTIIRFSGLPPLKLISGGLAIAGLSLILVSLTSSPFAGPLAFILAGAGLAIIQPLLNEWLQKEIPRRLLGLAFSLTWLIFLLASLAGIRGASLLAGRATLHPLIAGAGAGLLVISGVLLLSTHFLGSVSKRNN